jgi:Lhr-like helicase
MNISTNHERPGTAERWNANLMKRFPEKDCGNCRHHLSCAKEDYKCYERDLKKDGTFALCVAYQRFNPTP